ncbi:MAG TPA: hypothetical protein VGF97_14815 [Rhizomicrobium sp.]|jgi:hypothetical protein
MTRKGLLLFWLLVLPFMNAPLLNANLFDVTGMKPVNLLAATAFFVLLTGKRTFRWTDDIERAALGLLVLYVGAYSLTFFRSIGNLSTFHAELPEIYPASAANYVLSFYVRPLAEIVPFVFILKEMRSSEDIEAVMKTMGFSYFLLSLFFLYVVLIASPSALGADRNLMTATTNAYLGMHYNDLATVYFSAGGLLAFLAIRLGGLWSINLLLALVAVLLLQSRTGLITMGLAVAAVLVIFRRIDLVLAGIGVVAIVSAIKVAPTLESLGRTGLYGSHFTLDTLLTGRESAAWIPLTTEWFADWKLFLFGAGSFGMMTSPLWHMGTILQAGQAHNAFIDFFLNDGILLLVGLLVLLTLLLRRAYRFGRRLKSRLYWSLLVCPLAYLLGTVTGEQIFPSYMNMLIYPLLALLLNVSRRGTQQEATPRAVPSARPSAVPQPAIA